MQNHKIVSREEWLAARREHLLKEKEFTRLHDQLSQDRRQLPWVKVEKEYLFDGPNGKETLSDLFNGQSQLMIYHFMYGPDWEEGGPAVPFGRTISMGLLFILIIETSTLLLFPELSWIRWKPIKSVWGGVLNGCHHLETTLIMTITSHSRLMRLKKARRSITSSTARYRARRCPGSVCSSRTDREMCFIRTRVMHVDWTC